MEKKKKKKNNKVVDVGGGGGGVGCGVIFFKPSLNLCFFPKKFHNSANFSTTKKTIIYHTSNGITFNIKDVSDFFGDHMPS